MVVSCSCCESAVSVSTVDLVIAVIVGKMVQLVVVEFVIVAVVVKMV